MINNWLPSEAGSIIMAKADWEVFAIVRVRERHKCNICSSTIKKGQYCVGAGEVKYCLECSHKVFDNAVRSMGEVIEKLKKQKEIITGNRIKFDKHNIGYGLGDEENGVR